MPTGSVNETARLTNGLMLGRSVNGTARLTNGLMLGRSVNETARLTKWPYAGQIC